MDGSTRMKHKFSHNMNMSQNFTLIAQLVSWYCCRYFKMACILVLGIVTTNLYAQKTTTRIADYIVAVVNQESVTASELEERIQRFIANAKRTGGQIPPAAQLRHQILDSLIEERAILSLSRAAGNKIDSQEIERAIKNIAEQNQLSISELKEQIEKDGMTLKQFESNVRDQMLIERFRERDVWSRIEISDLEIDLHVEKFRAENVAAPEMSFNIAHTLVPLPDKASDADIKKIKVLAENVLKEALGGGNLEALAARFSSSKTTLKHSELGLKPASQVPDLFIPLIRDLESGRVAPQLAQSGAGFHILKLVERKESTAIPVNQTLVRHILLRTSDANKRQAAIASLMKFRTQIISGARTFESFAREFSEDGSATSGGSLGWSGPGTFVSEFETAMNKLPVGGVSGPVVSRFGVHLIQVLERRIHPVERKQLRDQARAVLRQSKYESTYRDWLKELRSRVYIEIRDPPNF